MSDVIRVPDIGSGDGQVIEIFVKVGDRIEADQSLLTLESDKASMEIPAPRAGVVKAIKAKLGDRLKEGDEILELDSEGAGATASAPEEPAGAASAGGADEAEAPTAEADRGPAERGPTDRGPTEAPADRGPAEATQEVRVPDIGSAGKAKVIEIAVKAGDAIEAEQSLITLESDKASMEIPSPAAGVVESLSVKVGDEIGTGDLILVLKGAAPAASGEAPAPADRREPAGPPKEPSATPQQQVAPNMQGTPEAEVKPAPVPAVGAPSRDGTKVHAGPAVRKLAREFGVALADVPGTGPRDRILKEDVQAYVQAMMKKAKAAPEATSGGAGIPPVPAVDFARFGEVEEVPMSRLMQVGAANLHRSWLNVPHVTQFESADITELEAFRVAQKAAAEKAGTKLTVLPILLKACAALLREMPDFNSSLAPGAQALIRKKYVHIGFAVDTPDGLLVPVIRDVDKKSLLQLAAEAAELAEKARTKKLSADAMQGACFTLSSLGHIGGTGFTPIVNAPEVAILGVSKATMQPVWDGKAFQPRLMLPLSLSYDHRVINGAAAARFTRRLAELLADIRTLLL